MNELGRVIGEITRAVDYQPRLHGRMAWRLHPEDFERVAVQLRDYCAQHDQPFMPLTDLYLVGVHVFADEKAPRMDP